MSRYDELLEKAHANALNIDEIIEYLELEQARL